MGNTARVPSITSKTQPPSDRSFEKKEAKKDDELAAESRGRRRGSLVNDHDLTIYA